MGVYCTIFSAAESDVPEPVALPNGIDDQLRYDDDLAEVNERLGELPRLGLDKAWDLLHFALGNHTGDHPLAFIEQGGEDVPALVSSELDSARFFSPAEVAAIREAVSAVSSEELARNFARRGEVDPTSLYPQGLAPFAVGDIHGPMKRLRAFLDQVVAAGRGIIVRIEA